MVVMVLVLVVRGSGLSAVERHVDCLNYNRRNA